MHPCWLRVQLLYRTARPASQKVLVTREAYPTASQAWRLPQCQAPCPAVLSSYMQDVQVRTAHCLNAFRLFGLGGEVQKAYVRTRVAPFAERVEKDATRRFSLFGLLVRLLKTKLIRVSYFPGHTKHGRECFFLFTGLVRVATGTTSRLKGLKARHRN